MARANGIQLYYELAGAGKRLLVISGTGGDLRRTPRLTAGQDLAGFELLEYDQRGLGRSAVPSGPYSMAAYGDDAAGLLAALGWDNSLVLGISFGGMVAQELAIRHPARVRRLVLSCTSAGGRGGASYPLHELVDLEGAGVSRHLELIDTRWDAAWQAENPEMVQMIAEGFQLGRDEKGDVSDGPMLQLEARRHHDTADRLGQISCPTLVCGGRYDGIAPPENSVSWLRTSRAPDSRSSTAVMASSCRTPWHFQRCSIFCGLNSRCDPRPGAVDSSHGPHCDTRVEGAGDPLRGDRPSAPARPLRRRRHARRPDDRRRR